jgi:hypothetical protein
MKFRWLIYGFLLTGLPLPAAAGSLRDAAEAYVRDTFRDGTATVTGVGRSRKKTRVIIQMTLRLPSSALNIRPREPERVTLDSLTENARRALIAKIMRLGKLRKEPTLLGDGSDKNPHRSVVAFRTQDGRRVGLTTIMGGRGSSSDDVYITRPRWVAPPRHRLTFGTLGVPEFDNLDLAVRAQLQAIEKTVLTRVFPLGDTEFLVFFDGLAAQPYLGLALRYESLYGSESGPGEHYFGDVTSADRATMRNLKAGLSSRRGGYIEQ